MTKSLPTNSQLTFFRRLLVAFLIESGTNTVPAIQQKTGMHRRTAQDTISGLKEYGIQCQFVGATKNGHYEITDWGPIKRDWVAAHFDLILRLLEYK